MSGWYVYMIRTARGALYTGISTDVSRRLGEHRAGAGRASRFLRGRGPLQLVYQVHAGERGLALRLESAIKRLPKTEKEAIPRRQPKRRQLLSLLQLDDT